MSGACIDYKDTITLVTTTVDNYGDDIEVDDQEDVRALCFMNTGTVHNQNQDAVTSDARVYVDPTETFVSDNFYRLEEMYVIIERYGSPEQRGWYKVINVSVAEDKLLCNQVDNIRLDLKKTASIYNVS